MTSDLEIVELQTVSSMPLQEALAALLRLQSIEVDADSLTDGLPIIDGFLPEELMERAVLRLGHQISWQPARTVSKMHFPCGLQVVKGGYVVAVGREGDTVQVLDARNPSVFRLVPIEVFMEELEGPSFQVLPGADLIRDRYSSGNEKKHWFWGRLFLQKGRLAEVIVASLLANLLAVVTSLFVLQVYDRVIPGQSEATLWVLASGVGLGILFEAILRISRARIIDRLGKEAEIDITSDLFARFIGMKLDKRPATPGAIVHMVREFSAVKEFFTTAAVGVVADLPFVLIFLLLIYGIAGNVVWVIAIGALLIVVPNLLLQNQFARLSREAMGGMSAASRLLTEASYGLETVKAARSESRFQRQWEEIIALNALKTTEQRSLSAMLTFWAASMQQTTYVFAVIAGVYMVFANDLSVGAIIAVGILSTRTLSPVSQLSQALSRWQNMKTALSGLESIMLSEQERDPERTYIRRPRINGEMTFQKVRYFHSGSKTVTLDIEGIQIKSGTRLALLGSNGSGKSTFLRLAAGLNQPSEGEILVDGLDMRQIDPSDLRRNIGYLPQEIQMFRGSLRDNLASGAQSFNDEHCHAALAFGGLGDFVRMHPEGLDLQISDGGGGLSIGQRQSIGLARLYLQDPSIILLDEPTAALDQNLESTLVARLGKWIGSRTCIVATHRPLILNEMTHVAVLQQGRVIMHGDRDSTIRKLTIKPATPNKPATPKLAGKG